MDQVVYTKRPTRWQAGLALPAAGGAANAHIARQLGCSVATVQTWRRCRVLRQARR